MIYIIVKILLGKEWLEASNVVGVWALSSGIVIVLGHYTSEVFIAKGKPKLSFIAQILHLIVLVPTCIIASRGSFLTLVYSRSFIRLQSILVDIILLHFIIGISVKDI